MLGCGRFFNCIRDTVSDKIIAVYKTGEPRPEAQQRAGRRDERAVSSRRVGSIDARARSTSRSMASLYRASRRHARLGASRQRRPSGRALLQISSAARNPLRRRGGAERAGHRLARARPVHAQSARDPDRAPRRTERLEPEPLALARIRCRRGQRSRVAAVPAGFYYKTFMGPNLSARTGPGSMSTSRRSAAPRVLASRPREPDPDRYSARSPIATCWSSAAARPGSPRRWPRAQAALASSCATNSRSSAVRCSPKRSAEIEAMSAREWLGEALAALELGAECAADAAHAGVRLLRAEFRRPERAHRRGRPHRRSRLAARALMAGARERGRAGDRRDRASAGVPGQRPPGHDARRFRAALLPPVWRQGRRARRRRDVARQRLSRRARSQGSGRRRRADRRSAPRGERAAARGRARGGHRGRGRRGDRRRRRAPAGQRGSHQASGRESEQSPATRCSCGAAGRLRCISSRSRAASSCSTRRCKSSCPARRPARAVGRGVQCDLRSCGRARGRRRGRARGGGRRGFARRRAGLRRRRRPATSAPALRAPPRADRRAQGVRRFPERRVRQGHEPGGAGGHALDRAHQALHHDRHGDRPGQDLEHERARDRRRRRSTSRSRRSA